MLAQAAEEHPLHGGTGIATLAGRPMVNLQKLTRIRMFRTHCGGA